MNPYNNLDPSLFHSHDASSNTPQNDRTQEYHHQGPQEMTQNYSKVHRPPGAESVGPHPPLPTQPYSTSLSLTLGHTKMGEDASLMPTSFPMNVQPDESNNHPFYSSSPSRSASLSPSHSYPLRASASGESRSLRRVTVAETEPKDLGIHPFPNCRHLGVTPTVISELRLNHPRSQCQS
jgi:hypothetical protein